MKTCVYNKLPFAFYEIKITYVLEALDSSKKKKKKKESKKRKPMVSCAALWWPTRELQEWKQTADMVHFPTSRPPQIKRHEMFQDVFIFWSLFPSTCTAV